MSQKLKKKQKPNKESERRFLNEIQSNGTDIGDNKGFEDAENYLQQRRAWLYSNLSLWDILIDCSDVMEDSDESIIGTKCGFFKVTDFRRLVSPEQRWDWTLFNEVVGVPWEPVPGQEGVQI